jgi:L-iditol 2-dehydrogenase
MSITLRNTALVVPCINFISVDMYFLVQVTNSVFALLDTEVYTFCGEEPMVIGHECAGVIEEVGSEVKALVAGDCTALEPGISCWRCKHCKGGRYNLCPDMKFFATPPYHGSLANQVC